MCYQLISSAFNIAEKPVQTTEDLLMSPGRLRDRSMGYLAGFVALPITLALIPVSIVADIIVGIIEIVRCKFQGIDNDDTLEVAKRKIVIAPAQQLVYLITNIALYAIFSGFSFSLCISSLCLWPVHHLAAKVAVTALTPISKMCIFSQEPIFSCFKNIKKGVFERYSRVDSATTPKEYIAFKERVLMGITGERLVGYNIFGDKEITDLHHSFQKLLDPDNNPYRYLEAQALLQYLNRNINKQEPEIWLP
jgi:hypothetical protein